MVEALGFGQGVEACKGPAPEMAYVAHGCPHRSKLWASLCNAFLVEARLFASGHIPKTEEYLNNGIVSSGIPVVLVHMFFLLGDGATNESANLVNNNPSIITSIATLLRLCE
ncbi:hypothetical protein RJ640_001536 [Escallonia rubra]|uniref:Terpene synthase metal-binding domain-containing protein n=1 Tax=Escallonia rubra TaxID=112253 RepID=A0AA88UN89_9ASTE|nr:hypothetical protein RJ640_001536 [Escallonia rubra]